MTNTNTANVIPMNNPHTETSPAVVTIADPRAALETVRQTLRTNFYERDDEIDGLLIALLIRENVLLLGPPGSAKSELIRALGKLISDTRVFIKLLTKFTTPEEIFGPISMKGLEEDHYRRITRGKLPEANIGFLDEIFKASSAILNSMLTVVNERKYENDGVEIDCPLISLIGASNETPSGEELHAMDDRFAIRFWTSYIRDSSMWSDLVFGQREFNFSPVMTLDQLRACQQAVRAVTVPQPVREMVLWLKAKLAAEGLVYSDRRWRQMEKVLRGYTYLQGADVVSEDHLEGLVPSLWLNPKDLPKVRQVVGSVGNPINIRVAEIIQAVREKLSALGSPNPANSTEVADWQKESSMCLSQISQMETELKTLKQANSGKSLKRLDDALNTVTAAKVDLVRRATALYKI